MLDYSNKPLNPKVSIIVPVYNQECFLEKCLESICSQTLKEIEIILINDGSTDGTRLMCETWAEKDSRIVLINQENKGLAETCNVGVSLAKGDYIGFVDSDDWVDVRMYEEMLSIAKEHNSEIVSCGINRMTQKEQFIHMLNSPKNRKILNPKESLLHIMLDQKQHSYRWNRIYKKLILNDILFPKGRVFEDAATTYLIFEKANRIVFSEKAFYFYRKHPTSITSSMNPKKEFDFLMAHLERYAFIEANRVNFLDREKKILKTRFRKLILKSYGRLSNAHKKGIPVPNFDEITASVKDTIGDIRRITYYKLEVIDFFYKIFVYNRF